MNGYCNATLLGNLTRDPELKYTTPRGAAVCEFSLACNSKWTGEDGQLRERVEFIECVAWNKAAETISSFVRKGSPLFISGALQQQTWEDRQTGKQRSKLVVKVDVFRFIDGKRDNEERAGRSADTAPQMPRQTAAAPPADDAPMQGDDVPF